MNSHISEFNRFLEHRDIENACELADALELCTLQQHLDAIPWFELLWDAYQQTGAAEFLERMATLATAFTHYPYPESVSELGDWRRSIRDRQLELLECLHASQTAVQAAAALALSVLDLAPPDLRRCQTQLVGSAAPLVQERLLWLLGRTCDPEFSDTIERYITSPNPMVRVRAAEAYIRVKWSRLEQAFVALATFASPLRPPGIADPSKVAQFHAISAVKELPGVAQIAIVRWLLARLECSEIENVGYNARLIVTLVDFPYDQEAYPYDSATKQSSSFAKWCNSLTDLQREVLRGFARSERLWQALAAEPGALFDGFGLPENHDEMRRLAGLL